MRTDFEKLTKNMITQTTVQQEHKSDNEVLIPDNLIFELLEGKSLYYADYQSVVNGDKTIDDIMGSSGVQSYFIAKIVEFLLFNLNRKEWQILYSELGLHISKNNNLSADIAIYDRKDLPSILKTKYVNHPPKIVIEVDTKIDYSNITHHEYVFSKTNKLLEFGVEKVVWVFTSNEKVFIAEANEDWIIRDWTKPIEVLEKSFTIKEIIDNDLELL